MRVELLAVIGDDPRRLLPAMLQRMQAECHERRRIGMAEDAEDPALIVKMVGIAAVGRLHARSLLEVVRP